MRPPGMWTLFFYGASNVQNVGQILQAFNPRITVGRGVEHNNSLFFFDVCLQVPQLQKLSEFGKEVLDSVWHIHSRQYNHCIYLGFIKPSESR
jgi:hypothetical protein